MTRHTIEQGVETPMNPNDPRLFGYSANIYKRITRASSAGTNQSPSHDQADAFWILSVQFAKEKIQTEDSADRDQLTGLLTRSGFYKHIGLRFQQYHRELIRGINPGPLAASALFIDVDNFKMVNDTYSHQVGDQALALVGHVIKTRIRPQDIAGRWGGDEFVVYFDRINLEDTILVADRIRTEITLAASNAFPHLTNWLKAISSGIFQIPTTNLMQPGQNTKQFTDTIVHQADLAHYHGAKNIGKNRIGIMLANGQIQTALIGNNLQN